MFSVICTTDFGRALEKRQKAAGARAKASKTTQLSAAMEGSSATPSRHVVENWRKAKRSTQLLSRSRSATAWSPVKGAGRLGPESFLCSGLCNTCPLILGERSAQPRKIPSRIFSTSRVASMDSLRRPTPDPPRGFAGCHSIRFTQSSSGTRDSRAHNSKAQAVGGGYGLHWRTEEVTSKEFENQTRTQRLREQQRRLSLF